MSMQFNKDMRHPGGEEGGLLIEPTRRQLIFKHVRLAPPIQCLQEFHRLQGTLRCTPRNRQPLKDWACRTYCAGCWVLGGEEAWQAQKLPQLSCCGQGPGFPKGWALQGGDAGCNS